MTQTSQTTIAPSARKWLTAPSHGHAVQLYCSDDMLLDSLTRFIGDGLSRGDSCIVIATLPHLQGLDMQLQSAGIDTVSVQLSGQLRTFDAEVTLAAYMTDGVPDLDKLDELVSPSIRQALQRNHPLRVYGEMTSLLWKDGHKQAVMTLEKLWDGWSQKLGFSLLCAYPKLHFVMNDRALAKLRSRHSINL